MTHTEAATRKKRILVMLGSRMARIRESQWNFPLFLAEPIDTATDLSGKVSGGSSRMRAVQAVYASLHEPYAACGLLVLVTGGNELDGSSRSDEAARQLVSRYKLPRNAVVSIKGAGSTIGNAAATVEFIKNHHVEVSTIEIVTNDYHMLRAWIIFSRAMLLAATGRKLAVSATDQDRIKQILLDGLPCDDNWRPARIKKDRDCVITILQPYFSGAKPKIVPIVVEEILEVDSSLFEAGRRYAQRLRNSVWVKRTLRHEYERIMNEIANSSH